MMHEENAHTTIHKSNHLSVLVLLWSTNKPLRREPESRARPALKDNKLALEEDITPDGETDAGVRLDTTEAGGPRSVNGSVVDVVTWHDGLVGADAEGDAGESGAAGVGVATLSGIGRGARDLGVVGLNYSVRKVEESGTSVGDGINAGRLERRVTDRVAVACEFPETLGRDDGDVSDAASVFGVVDFTEAISAWLPLLQVRCEERSGESVDSIGEERLLRLRPDGVDIIKGKAEETVVGLVIDELTRNSFGELNSLAADGCLADFDNVRVDIPRGGRAITVPDRPGVAGLGFGRFGFGRVVDIMSSPLGSGLLGGEDPTRLG